MTDGSSDRLDDVATNWLSVTVELLGGRGDALWPPPGRVLALGPSHTFMDLPHAINTAFGRWDHAHLSLFVLPDGRVVTDPETGEWMDDPPEGPALPQLDIGRTKVAHVLAPGAEFQYTFDLGDEWVHRCVVDADLIDPRETFGTIVGEPLAYFGWGDVPDQYGRRWAEDTGEEPIPRKPATLHPMILGRWPVIAAGAGVEMVDVRRAVAARDVDAYVASLSGRDIDDVLQQVAEGLPFALEQDRAAAEPVVRRVVDGLDRRDRPGDAELREDLMAVLRGQELPGTAVPVDLDELSSLLEGGIDSSGGWLDRRTGEVLHDESTDPAMVGEEHAVDVEEDPDRWLRVDPAGSRDGWRDMADFGAGLPERRLRAQVERAIEGKGAFRRFKDLVHREGLAEHWYDYSTERKMGRARQWLADEGVRVGPRDV